jgi:hypothetical protein
MSGGVNNMADAVVDRDFVLNSLLSFVVTKFVKLDIKHLKGIILSFFSGDDISIAKYVLLSAVGKMNIDKPLTRCPDRQGANRTERELDDIFAMLTQLDERKLFSDLPYFVTDNIESVPSVHLEDGDMRFLLAKMDKMESIIQGLQATIHALFDRISSQPLVHMTESVKTGVINNQRTKVSSVNQPRLDQHESTVASNNTISSGLHQSRLWSDRLQSEDATNDDESNDAYELVGSRRKKRRIRNGQNGQQLTSSSQATTSNFTGKPPTMAIDVPSASYAGAVKQPSKIKPGGPRKPLLLGRRQIADRDISSSTFHAAKPFKSVYCVDNVSKNIDENQLSAFVNSLGVRVVSCHMVKPRLSIKLREYLQSNNLEPDHNTFRLCIYKADNELLLVADKWPTDITISTWFFKETSATAAQGQSSGSSMPVTGINAPKQLSTNVSEDMDETFIVHGSIGVVAEGSIMPLNTATPIKPTQ